MKSFDYVIVGAGAAGCVLAYRLTEDPTISVALLEAGQGDSNPFITMPKGLGKIMLDMRYLWPFPTAPEPASGGKAEQWVRGRVVGGSTSVNGMMYVRGQPADFNELAETAGDDWSWPHIGAAYQALENHPMGAAATRGANGPLRLSLPEPGDPLNEAMIAAGTAMGLPRKEDSNAPDDGDGIGYAPCTIREGRRQSASRAFLAPALARPNLTLITGALVDKVLFDGKVARSVAYQQSGRKETVTARKGVILCGGALASPAVLERSGIGAPGRLAELGIPLVHANPAVGENLSEHRGLLVQWKLKHELSQNREYAGWRLLRNVLRYFLTRKGPMSTAAYGIGAWLRTEAGLNRPDAQLLAAPFSLDFAKNRAGMEPFPGMHVVAYTLRPTSRGSLHIISADPAADPRLSPNYRSTEEDRRKMVALVHRVREYAATEPLKSLIEIETMPGPAYQTDAQILDAYDSFGTCGYHAVGTCRIGRDEASVVDPQLRVRGVEGLFVMDTSVFPVIPSGNTNGPTMAMAWRAADVIRRVTM